MIEATLNKLAEHILGLDEASLASLWQKYKARTENFEISKEWEKAVIIFFIINAVRAKNHMFNEEIQKRQQPQPEPERTARRPRGKPDLRRVK
jgi:NADH:ubiquinone oxidoreductase subunit